MKLLMLMIAGLLAAPGVATADDDVLYPPGGPVYVSNDLPEAAAPQRPMQGRQRAMQKQLARALVAQFDINGDGRLGPRERMRAIRVLRRIEQRLAGPGMQGKQGMPGIQGKQGKQGMRARRQRFIERFDTNGDGHVGPQEMPPGAARKLRRFDRDHDGWLEPHEMKR